MTSDRDIEALNERFGHPPDAVVVSGQGGLATVQIDNPHGRAAVTLHGGHVLSFQPRGERAVLWISRHSHFTPGVPIRGGIPLCWPWFGPHPTDAGKPSHGFARTAMWSVTGLEVLPDRRTRVRLALSDSEHTRALWGHAFALELVVTAGTELDVELVVRNPGPTAFDCTGALHSYFAISDIAAIRIDGLGGGEYLDKVLNHQRLTQAGPIEITRETDRVYVDTKADCVIADAGWRRAIRIGKRGSRTTVVWNPWVERARQLGDFGDDEYRGMVCVETANAANDVVTVEPGGEHRLATTLSSMPG